MNTKQTTKQPSRIIRLREVISKTGIGRSRIYAGMKAGQFPQSIRLGVNSIGWVEAEIDDWIAEQIKASRKK